MPRKPESTEVQGEIVVASTADRTLFRPVSTRTDENPVLIYLGALRLGSRRTMKQSLECVASMNGGSALSFPWWKIRYQHMRRIQRLLSEKLAPATVNKMMSAVKGVLLECRRLKLISADNYSETIDFKRVKASSVQKGRMIEREEIVQMLAGFDSNKPIDVRDKGLLLTLATGGVRRDEAANIQTTEFDVVQKTIFISKAKGGKTRKIQVGNELMRSLCAWLEVRGTEEGPLFCPVYKGGHISPHKQIATQTVYFVVNKVSERAKLKEGISPHDFRRTFISMLLDAGIDLKTVSKMVGHEQTDTTGKYDRRDEKAQRKAIDMLQPFEVT